MSIKDMILAGFGATFVSICSRISGDPVPAWGFFLVMIASSWLIQNIRK